MSKELADERNPHFKLKIKVQKKYPDFTDSVDGLSIEDLRKNMLIYATYKEETSTAKSSDIELSNAQELVKELSAPYNETLSALKDKITYIHALLVEKKTE
jgi:hypothetical protein